MRFFDCLLHLEVHAVTTLTEFVVIQRWVSPKLFRSLDGVGGSSKYEVINPRVVLQIRSDDGHHFSPGRKWDAHAAAALGAVPLNHAAEAPKPLATTRLLNNVLHASGLVRRCR
jgi:hypothetical protein